jgi:uncharacterized membrane protein (DUF373 family)
MHYIEKFAKQIDYKNLLSFVITISLGFLQIFFSIILVVSIIYAFKNLYVSFPDLKNMLKTAVSDGLYIFVLIELIKSVNDYFKYKRVKLTVVIDIAMIFLLREMMIGVFQHSMNEFYIISLGVVLLILMIMRILAIKFSPDSNVNKTS